MLKFSQEQEYFIQQGAAMRRSLIDTIVETVETALQPPVNDFDEWYCDAIISGTMGIGKTYNAIKELNAKGIYPIVIKGNQSIANLSGALMAHHYRFTNRTNPEPGEKLVIVFDDCDSLFETRDSINLLKGMTGKPGERMFQHNVQVNKHQYSDFVQTIMNNYAPKDGSSGIHVSCEDMIFIFTTNFTVPTEREAKEYASKKGNTPQANKKMDLAAIRRRFTPTPNYVLPKKINWGWIVEVALNDGGLDMLPNEQDKIILLDWMWNNWDTMTETNLSTMEKMAIQMLKFPDSYRDRWERSFIDQMLAI